jgi:VWFA-related protein
MLLVCAVARFAAQPVQVTVTQVSTSQAAWPKVTAFVSIVGASGEPIAGITEQAFTLREDALPITDARFSSTLGPTTIILVLDKSSSMREAGKIESAKEACLNFIQAKRPDDQIGLVTFNQSPTLDCQPTTDIGTLTGSIGGVFANGQTALYDALNVSLKAFDEKKPGRKAVVLLTDGMNTAGAQSPEGALGLARKLNVPVYTIGLGDPSAMPTSGIVPDNAVDEAALTTIASSTGGRYFHAPTADQLNGIYEAISAQLQKAYQIDYTSPEPTASGEWRTFEVSVTHQGMAIQAAKKFLTFNVDPTRLRTGNAAGNLRIFLSFFAPLCLLLFMPAIARALRRKPAQTYATPMPSPATPVTPSPGPVQTPTAVRPIPPAPPLAQPQAPVRPASPSPAHPPVGFALAPARQGLSKLRLTRGLSTIGRNPGNSMVINDPSVASFHARIVVEEGRVVVEDVSGQPGTMVNFAPAAGSVWRTLTNQRNALKIGSIVKFGTVSFKLTQE